MILYDMTEQVKKRRREKVIAVRLHEADSKNWLRARKFPTKAPRDAMSKVIRMNFMDFMNSIEEGIPLKKDPIEVQ